jgi:putative SbcD/Mre11-related phosphoesterase
MMVHGDWLLTAARVAIHQPTRTAVLADLHLGYAEARQKRGEAVPLQELEAVLRPLDNLITEHHVAEMVIAGDLFEAGHSSYVAAALVSWLRQRSVRLRGVVPGNHDRGLAAGGALPVAEHGYQLGDWMIVHGDQPRRRGRILQGHEHPCLRWAGVSAPCYLLAPDRLILPSYSLDAAGVNVVARARWQSFTCAAIVGDRVLDFGVLRALRASLRASRQAIEEGSARGHLSS